MSFFYSLDILRTSGRFGKWWKEYRKKMGLLRLLFVILAHFVSLICSHIHSNTRYARFSRKLL